MYEEYKFDLARNSLRYLIKRFNIKEIYLPYYLCDVVRHAVFEEHCRSVFYHIDDTFYPAQTFPAESFVLYPNYFGICDNNVNELEKKYPNLIVDNAHAFYLPPQGFACFNSERKFRNVVEGSYLWIKNADKTENSELLTQGSVIEIINSRIEKFNMIHDKYGETNQLKIDIVSVKSPFCYPYLAKSNEEADILAKQLSDDGFIIYRYWNNLPQSYNEYKFYRRLVPIPI